MKYILLMNSMKTGSGGLENWPEADAAAHLAYGPFTETKEILAGFWVVDVATAERAYEIAARASAAPGIGGAPLNMPIEVRPVLASIRPEDLV